MSHTIRNQFDKHLTFEALLSAHIRASKTKRYSLEVLKFEVDLESNIINLLNKLKDGSYKMGKYREFKIYEPKQRVIRSLPYVDRIVHQWYIYEFIKPYIIPRFINDSYACIEGRGTHKAVDKAQYYMRLMKKKYNNYYLVKCDIKGFFYNIDKDILYSILKEFILDSKLLKLTYEFVYNDLEKVGIPIGNYTSQFFANIYLNKLDWYVKSNLRIKCYVRYMDDFVMFVKTKEEAKELLKIIDKFVKDELHLELNSKSRYYPNKMGLDFCGFRIYESYRLLRKRKRKKIKRKVKIWNILYEKGILDVSKTILEWNAFLAHSSHAKCYKLQWDIYNKIIFKEELKKPKNKEDIYGVIYKIID